MLHAIRSKLWGFLRGVYLRRLTFSPYRLRSRPALAESDPRRIASELRRLNHRMLEIAGGDIRLDETKTLAIKNLAVKSRRLHRGLKSALNP